LEGPAASEEASQHPVFFDTLEHRQQDPERELFPKCLRGGQASARRRKAKAGRRLQGCPANRIRFDRKEEGTGLVHLEGRDGESPREAKSQESQDADCAGETRWRTSQPAGGSSP
jgi:hypothetical protein